MSNWNYWIANLEKRKKRAIVVEQNERSAGLVTPTFGQLNSFLPNSREDDHGLLRDFRSKPRRAEVLKGTVILQVHSPHSDMYFGRLWLSQREVCSRTTGWISFQLLRGLGPVDNRLQRR